MESSIKIGFADYGNGLEPIINVTIIDTDDPRDQLVRSFFQKLGGESSWLKIYFRGSGLDANKHLTIHPIIPNELHSESGEMSKRSLEFTEAKVECN